jgi:SAM-dependent methyltransferase
MELTFTSIVGLIIIYFTAKSLYSNLGDKIWDTIEHLFNKYYKHRGFYMKKTGFNPVKRNVAVLFHGKIHGVNFETQSVKIKFINLSSDIIYTFDRDEFTNPDYVTDLSKDDSLSFIPNEVFDVIYISLCACCTKHGVGKIREAQARQLVRILKPKGLIAIKRHNMYKDEEWNSLCQIGLGGRFSAELQANIIEDKLFLMKGGIPLIQPTVESETPVTNSYTCVASFPYPHAHGPGCGCNHSQGISTQSRELTSPFTPVDMINAGMKIMSNPEAQAILSNVHETLKEHHVAVIGFLDIAKRIFRLIFPQGVEVIDVLESVVSASRPHTSASPSDSNVDTPKVNNLIAIEQVCPVRQPVFDVNDSSYVKQLTQELVV